MSVMKDFYSNKQLTALSVNDLILSNAELFEYNQIITNFLY